MKSKQNAKNRRQQFDAKKAALTAEIAAKKRAEAQQMENEKKRLEAEKAAMSYAAAEKKFLEDHPLKKRRKKSGVKSAGVKSLFTLKEGEMLITTFGKQNTAIPEKIIRNGAVEDLQETPAFIIKPREKYYVVSNNQGNNAVLKNPCQFPKTHGNDLIGLRKQFEKKYFGQTFEDNIHIQLIYNILDIEKILTVHVHNITYGINNLLFKGFDGESDLFQSLDASKSFEQFVSSEGRTVALMKEVIQSPRRTFFGDVLFMEEKISFKTRIADMPEKRKVSKERYYYLLALIGTARRSLAYGTSIIYQLGNAKNAIRKEALKCLDDLYAKRIQSINDQFISHAREKNLPVLFEALNVTDEKHKEQLSREYYYFIVRKEHKNQGFSIRKIRELILLLPDAEKLTEQQYDRVHAKLYMLLDFVIFDWYRNHPKSATALVSNLRSAPTEEDKLRCYSKAIVPLWKDIKASVMGHIAEQLSASHVTKIPPVQIENDVLNPVWISQHASYFSELIYLLTCFQSGKETNDLLTTLVNKFESIASFLQVMKNQDLTCNFVREYQMFYDSRKIADELRIVNAIARMKTEADDDLIKSRMCACNAVRLLGFKGDEQTLIKFIDEMYDMMIPHHLSKNYSDYSFRNFIFCNVTGFKYFQYLLRYGDPEKLHKLARSKKAVAFVLKGIPNAQIAYYYNGSMGVNTSFNPNMREELQIIIANVNISDFKNVRTNEKFSTAKERAEKQQKKMIAHLYLTVLYLLVKNLVYVNSRYFMAFHCLERDASVYDLKKYRNSCNHKERLREFAMERVEQGMLNKRATCYMKQNFANSDPFFITKFRSAVEHLSVVRNADKYIDDIAHFNSYFELYHYLLQRSLIDSYRYDIEHGKITNESVNPALLKYMALVEKYHTYCKDMVKVLNVPFAYNLPRYKNLSINELFDRNNYLPDATSKDAVKSE